MNAKPEPPPATAAFSEKEIDVTSAPAAGSPPLASAAGGGLFSRGEEPIYRELSQDEILRWGACPVCPARHREPCQHTGPVLGHASTPDGYPEGGAHLGRLLKAPKRVREVPA